MVPDDAEYVVTMNKFLMEKLRSACLAEMKQLATGKTPRQTDALLECLHMLSETASDREILCLLSKSRAANRGLEP